MSYKDTVECPKCGMEDCYCEYSGEGGEEWYCPDCDSYYNQDFKEITK